MRLRRLALTRYGRFTDRVLEFGPAVAGQPDLHIVYGPNEAGKSTAFAGYLDLLFGIEVQSRYNFLHPYDAMRLGGSLELAAGVREVSRIKRRQNALLDAAGQPLPESLILGELGGLDRAAYRTMFSLDDETLEAGGNSILASQGELGQLLFAASAGLAELSRMLLGLREQADGFTRPNARSGELHRLKAELAALKQAREAVDTLASDYARLAAERDRAAADYDAALAEQAGVQAAAATAGRHLAALPLLAKLRRLRARLPDFAGLPDAPPGWLQELPGLERDESHHHTATRLAAAEVRRLTEALEGIAADPAALGLADALAALATLAARHRTAEQDLPLRQRELARAEGEIAGLLAQLGRAGEAAPERLQLTAAQSAGLDALMAQRSGLDARLAAAAAERAEALRAAAEARQALAGAPAAASPGLLVALGAALQALRDSDHPRRLRDALRDRQQQQDALEALLPALLPWRGEIDALATLAVPDAAEVAAWQEAAARDAALLESRRADVERLEGEQVLRQAGLEALARVAGPFGDPEAAAARGAREAAWAAHRHALDATTATAFETALRQDDLLGAARLGQARDLAKMQETAQAAAVQQAALARAEALLAEVLATQARHAARVAAAATGIGPELAGLSPARLLAWMARREEAVACGRTLRQAGRDARAAAAEAEALHARLRGALAAATLPDEAWADETGTDEALAAAAQAVLEGESRLAGLRQSAAEADRDLRRREDALAEASQGDAAWHAAWRAACRDCWLGEAAADLPLGAVHSLLATARDLGPSLRARADLAARIGGMADDQAAFRRALERLARALGLEGAGPALELEQAIATRVRQAQQAEAEQRRLRAELAEAEVAQRAAQAAAQAHAARIGAMLHSLRADSLIDVSGKLHAAQEKAALLATLAETEGELLAALRTASLPAAEALLDGLSDAALQVEQASLATQGAALEAATRALFAARQEAAGRIAAIGGDDAVARIEERRRTQLLEIEERARHYLHLRLGIAAADRALRAYRDQHRSAMMTSASEAFRMISRGAYRGLGTQPGRDGEILVALPADGGSKLAAELSKGTRFQLYLALRAAGYREFARLRPPVPFIADDIMETFDDGRAEETLKLLGEMSRLGQVIYLTHHDHLRAIAERVVPGVRVHRLAG